MAEVGLRWCGINAASTERRILTELLSFPAGKHDDQVDALGLVGQLLDKISAGPRPKPPEVTRWLLRGVRANAGRQSEDDVRRTMTRTAVLFSCGKGQTLRARGRVHGRDRRPGCSRQDECMDEIADRVARDRTNAARERTSIEEAERLPN